MPLCGVWPQSPPQRFLPMFFSFLLFPVAGAAPLGCAKCRPEYSGRPRMRSSLPRGCSVPIGHAPPQPRLQTARRARTWRHLFCPQSSNRPLLAAAALPPLSVAALSTPAPWLYRSPASWLPMSSAHSLCSPLPVAVTVAPPPVVSASLVIHSPLRRPPLSSRRHPTAPPLAPRRPHAQTAAATPRARRDVTAAPPCVWLGRGDGSSFFSFSVFSSILFFSPLFLNCHLPSLVANEVREQAGSPPPSPLPSRHAARL